MSSATIGGANSVTMYGNGQPVQHVLISSPLMRNALQRTIGAQGLMQVIFGFFFLIPLAILTGVFATTIVTPWILCSYLILVGIAGLVVGCQTVPFSATNTTPEERQLGKQKMEKLAKLFGLLTVVGCFLGVAAVIHGAVEVTTSNRDTSPYAFYSTPIGPASISMGLFLMIVNLILACRISAVLKGTQRYGTAYVGQTQIGVPLPAIVVGGYHPAPPQPYMPNVQGGPPAYHTGLPYPAASGPQDYASQTPYPNNPPPGTAPPAYSEAVAQNKY